MPNVLEKLPQTRENGLWLVDQSVNSFIHLLEENPDDPYKVIDEMFLFYTGVVNAYNERMLHMEKRLTINDMVRLGRFDHLKDIINKEQESSTKP